MQIDEPIFEEQDAIDIRKFLSEFRKRLLDNKTDKTLIRMIYDNLQAFGPNTVGSNLLLNRFMNKNESILHKIEALLNRQIQRNLDQSNLPTAAVLSLAP